MHNPELDVDLYIIKERRIRAMEEREERARGEWDTATPAMRFIMGIDPGDEDE